MYNRELESIRNPIAPDPQRANRDKQQRRDGNSRVPSEAEWADSADHLARGGAGCSTFIPRDGKAMHTDEFQEPWNTGELRCKYFGKFTPGDIA